ncbi:MAG: ParB/RepB/Spo0J family partition protein [Deltaproteobacteria bacterium]|nr:ParB/RepB/Spo0J family partition protein [Deltaproteobacteria bacterium]
MTDNFKKAPAGGRRGLGKGLGALLPRTEAPAGDKLILCSLSFIEPDERQPRRRFDPEKLAELAASIKEKGVVQPVLVRPTGEHGRYRLVAGERRWRAAQQAGLAQIPAIVLSLDDRQAVEVSLIENLQREDLNVVEEARGYQRLIEEFSFSHEEVARTLGKDRSTVTNMLRLLNLAPEVLAMLEENRLSMGHGRALLAVGDPEEQVALARQVAARRLSVRQTERLVKGRGREESAGREAPGKKPRLSLHEQALCDRLQQSLQTRVNLRWLDRERQRGCLEIEFYDAEELQRLAAQLTGGK